MWDLIARYFCAGLYLSLLGASVSAQTPSPDAAVAIGLGEALSRTIAGNLELIAFGYQIDGAEGRLQQAELAPNPELTIGLEDVLGADTRRGFNSAETTITLGRVLERGVRQRIVDAARADLSLRNLDAEILRLDAAAETARRFLACLAHQGRRDNVGKAIRLAEERVRLVSERVAAGRSFEAELARAEVDLAKAELLQEDYEHELLSAYHRLSAQWGETQPDFSSVRGNIEELPELQSFETLLARSDSNPELLRFMSQQRLEEAELRLAQARGRPSWQVSAGLRRFENTDDFAVVGGLTIPLPAGNRNQGRIAEARADVARTRAEMSASRVRVEAALFVLHQALAHNLHIASRLTTDVIPRLERALEDTRSAYELGRYGYSEWRIVQEELLDANNELLEARIDAHGIIIEIERLTGVRAAPLQTAQGD